jgi:magnesium-protoporphyrin O-methyltransferase
MNCCKSNQCLGIEEVFDTGMAESDLKRYTKKGPSKATRRLLEALRKYELRGESLMDIGGGIGIIQHELVQDEIKSVVNVDASPAYSEFAKREAVRRGYDDRAQYLVGDFVDLASDLEPADIVTLDRVICCYDDMEALVSASVKKSKRLLGVIYPIDRFIFRFVFAAVNFIQNLFNRNYNMFAHRNEEVEALIAAGGFNRKYYHRGFLWQVAVYEK